MDKLAEKLKAFLAARKHFFTTEKQGPGGCETCGYGADEYDVIDMDQLDKQIDEFCATFQKEIP